MFFGNILERRLSSLGDKVLAATDKDDSRQTRRRLIDFRYLRTAGEDFVDSNIRTGLQSSFVLLAIVPEVQIECVRNEMSAMIGTVVVKFVRTDIRNRLADKRIKLLFCKHHIPPPG